jgi:hypothetical protein
MRVIPLVEGRLAGKTTRWKSVYYLNRVYESCEVKRAGRAHLASIRPQPRRATSHGKDGRSTFGRHELSYWQHEEAFLRREGIVSRSERCDHDKKQG